MPIREVQMHAHRAEGVRGARVHGKAITCIDEQLSIGIGRIRAIELVNLNVNHGQ